MSSLEAQSLMGVFLDECLEGIEAMSAALLVYEKSRSQKERDECITKAFRSAHNMKGAATLADINEMAEVCHDLEERLGEIRDGTAQIEPQIFTSQVLSVLEALQKAVSRLRDSAGDDIPSLADIFPDFEFTAARQQASTVDVSPASKNINTECSIDVAPFDDLRCFLCEWRKKYTERASRDGSPDEKQILGFVDQALERLYRVQEPTKLADPGAKSARVLVVDDSRAVRAAQKQFLEAAGYEVILAVDGQEAQSILQNDRFHIVVSDVEMPRMDGFSLARSIRQTANIKDMPIILLTGLDDEQSRRKGFESGANDYLNKTVTCRVALLASIEKLLSEATLTREKQQRA